jgi:general secretion pathway protein A
MYEKFYGLKEKPFNMTPDPEFLFFTEQHTEAFEHLRYGIRERRGFIEITGEVGAGKTTLCRALLNEFEEETKIALILNPFLTDIELLRTINEEFYIDASGESKKTLLDSLDEFLIEQHSQNNNVVLVVDEAQNLPTDTLEQIRIISNLETVKAKLIQIVLVGQPELREKLMRRELRQLNQRITVRYHINALNRKEAAQYISHRLKIAGSAGEIVFSDAAVDEIYSFSKGIPRMINVICDYALLTGYVAETFEITRDIVKKARKEVQCTELGSGFKTRFIERWKPVMVGSAAAILVFALGTILYPKYFNSTSQPTQRNIDNTPYMGNIAGAGNSNSTSTPVKNEHEGDPVMLPTPVAISMATQTAVLDTDIDLEVIDDTTDTVVKPDVSQATAVMVAANDILDNTAVAIEYSTPEAIPTPAIAHVEKPSATPGYFDTDGVLRCKNRAHTRGAALLSVLNRWGYESAVLEEGFRQDIASTDNVASDPLQQDWSPLQLVSLNANIKKLSYLNLPSVLVLYEPDVVAPKYVSLLSTKDNKLQVGDPIEGLREIDMNKLADIWFGRALIFCEQSWIPQRPLGVGCSGEDVKTLQQQLARLGLLNGRLTGYFGKSTKKAVMSFQKRARIKTDGIAGRETGLYLYSALAGPKVPRLISENGKETPAGETTP